RWRGGNVAFPGLAERAPDADPAATTGPVEAAGAGGAGAGGAGAGGAGAGGAGAGGASETRARPAHDEERPRSARP
ncbi:hypothetical protein ACFCZV_36020, partial [Streptomyces hydrogenans]